MALLVILGLIITPLILVTVVFLFGFRLGGEHSREQLAQMRIDAAKAERQLHDLTKHAFVAMSDHVARRHQDRA